MTNIIDININGQNADYKKSESLPVSLKIKTDKFFKVIGTEGIKIDNAAKQILLPATLNNQDIVSGIDGLADTSINVNGISIFRGNSALEFISRKNGKLNGYSLSLSGGVRDLFTGLAGKTLRTLSLGDIVLNDTTVQAGWAGGYDNGDNVVFAPVFYGYTGSVDNNIPTEYLRPSTYFASILRAIWAELGITIESTFFETDYFKEYVHLYGVGEQWQIGGTDASDLRTTTVANQTITTTTYVKVQLADDSTGVNFDTGNVWILDTGTAAAGQWTFEIQMGKFKNLNVEFVIDGLYSQPLSSLQSVNLSITVPATTTFYIRARKIFTANEDIEDGTILKARRDGIPGLGSTINIASTLPGRPLVDFLAGISHLFNLAWFYDPIRKRLYSEPRFDYTLPDGITRDGFYKRISNNMTDWSDRFDIGSYTEKPFEKPFDDWLVLNNMAEDSQWYKQAAGRNQSTGISFMGARFDFGGTGRNGKTDRNPYFENLLIVDGTPGAGGVTNCDWMPCIMEDTTDGATQYPEAKYESSPKYGVFKNAAPHSWKYNGSVLTTRPMIYFKPPPSNQNLSAVNASYSDYFDSSGLTQHLPGLMRTFYPQWLAILRKGAVVSGRFIAQMSDLKLNPSLFRDGKVLTLQQTSRAFIFLGVDKFQPLKGTPAEAAFVQIVPATEEDLALFSHSLQDHYNTFEF